MLFDQWFYRNWRFFLIGIATLLFLHSVDILFSRTNREDLNRALIAHCRHNKKCIEKKYKKCFGRYFDNLSTESTAACITQ